MVTAPLNAAAYIASTHVCPDCSDRSRLAVRWKGGHEQVWCSRCGRTEGFQRKESLMAQWRRAPESVPVQIANIFERKVGSQPMTEQALVTVSEAQLVQRMEKARWLADLQPNDRLTLAHLSQQYGLDPLMRELVLYEGAPYITVAGLIRIVHRQKLFAGLEDRPMTEEERTQYGYKAPCCWIAKVYRKDWKMPAVGTGTADPNNRLRNNPVEAVRPEWMARARALRQAIKLAFPHSLPFEEEPEGAPGIDPETGEIIEGRATVIETPPANSCDIPDFGPPEQAVPTIPAELTASPIPEAHEEAEAIADAKRRVLALAEKCRWKPQDGYALFKEHFFENTDPHVQFDKASLDLLNAWADRLSKALQKSAAAGK